MASKITLQDLASSLSLKSNLSPEESDTFLRSFFEVVKENVTDTKGVKIKGLGTFKLINVLDRESVDVNTGNRILIPGHPKVTFTPDNDLKAKVNRPFEAFSTIIINEGTNIEDMERIDTDEAIDISPEEDDTFDSQPTDEVEGKDEATPPAIEPEPDNSSSINDASEISESTPPPSDIESETEEGENSESFAAPTHEEEDESSGDNVNAEDDSSSNLDMRSNPSETSEPDECENRTENVLYIEEKTQKKDNIHVLLYALLIVCLILGSYFAGYYRLLCPCLDGIKVPEKSLPLVVEDKQKNGTDAMVSDTTSVDSMAKQELPQNVKAEMEDDNIIGQEDMRENLAALASEFSQVPDGDFLIVGTIKVRIMKKGDNLYKFAKEELGNKDLARYIIVHNDFKNPDVIPLDYEVKIPKLVFNE